MSLVAVAMVIASTVGSLTAVALSVRAQVAADLRGNLERAQEALDFFLKQKGESVAAGTRAVANNPVLKATMSSGGLDTPTLDGIAEAQREAIGADVLVLLDADGRPLGASPNEARTAERRWIDRVSVAEPASIGDQLYLLAVEPVDAGPVRLGYIAAGAHLDDAFAQTFARQSGAELVLLSGGTIHAKAVQAADASRLARSVVRDGLWTPGELGAPLLALRASIGADVSSILVRDPDREFARFRMALFMLVGVGLLSATAIGGIGLWATRRLTRPLRELTESATRIAEGDDFGVRIDVSGSGEIGQLADALRKLMERLRGVLGQLQQAGLQIGSTTEQLLSTARAHEDGAATQLSALSDTSSTTQRLAQFAQQIATEASSVASTADKTLGAAQSGQVAVSGFSDSVARMKDENAAVARAAADLAKKSQQIQKAIATINAVADRADVLALNAELEGAKAGEVGRGFSLVAAEVRRMAESTLSATRQIEALIEQIALGTKGVVEATQRGTAAVDQGVVLASGVTQSLLTIVELAGRTNEAAQSISAATSDQESGTAMLVAAMDELVSVTERGLQATQQTSKANHDLSELAHRLKQVVERFRIEQ